MTIQQLIARLESIKGDSPVARARRLAILAEIGKLMSGE